MSGGAATGELTKDLDAFYNISTCSFNSSSLLKEKLFTKSFNKCQAKKLLMLMKTIPLPLS